MGSVGRGAFALKGGKRRVKLGFLRLTGVCFEETGIADHGREVFEHQRGGEETPGAAWTFSSMVLKPLQADRLPS